MSNILIVEDQAHMRAILKERLREYQYRVDEAADLSRKKGSGWKNGKIPATNTGRRKMLNYSVERQI
jgi:hypothetical protein